jgi:plastocyanin
MINSKGKNMKQLFVVILSIAMLCSTKESAFAGSIVGKVTAHGVKNSGDAVVYIEKIESKSFPAPKEHALMDQKGLKFHPHVLQVLAGTTVDFLNSDDVLHNVFSPDACADKVNLGTWPKGQKRAFVFKNPGCQSVLLCNVHPEMEAFVVVCETPYFAVSAADGSYEIKDVPPGKYTLKIWHEKLKGQPVQIEVSEKGEAKADFDIHK